MEAGRPSDRALTSRCAIYTRKSTTTGLEQEFNSLDAQWEACSGFVRRQEGWTLVDERYDDGGFYVELAIMLRSALFAFGTQREARYRTT